MNRATAKRILGWAVLALLAGLILPRDSRGSAEPAPPPAAAAKEMTVALQEISVRDLANERIRESFLRGQYSWIRAQKGIVLPVKWPSFSSDAPLYGQVDFRNLAPGERKSDQFYFALDSSVKGGDCDLLYFDENGDADLTNDKPRKPAPQWSSLSRRSSSFKETYFDPVTMTFDFGPGGTQPLEVLPCLRVYQGSTPQFSFVAAHVHSGRFEIDGTSYEACVGYQYEVGGRLDEPRTALILAAPDEEPASWWGGDQLCAVHRLGGRFWRFACTPTGDKLFVRPYDGPVGTFEIGAGGRKVERLTARGSLRSNEAAVAIGGALAGGWPGPAQRCDVPAGDYYPAYLTIELGDLSISLSNNYHANAQGQLREGREPVRGIAIRADKPYVLDFSNKPVVVFTQPDGAPERQFARGEEIQIKAVLIDPVLDVMIRRLNTVAPGASAADPPQSLDPKVVIKRTNGEIVAEGVMPFG